MSKKTKENIEAIMVLVGTVALIAYWLWVQPW